MEGARQTFQGQVLTVCIRQDDIRTLSSKLQCHPLQVTLCCSLLDQVPNLHRGENRNYLPHPATPARGLDLAQQFNNNPFIVRAFKETAACPGSHLK